MVLSRNPWWSIPSAFFGGRGGEGGNPLLNVVAHGRCSFQTTGNGFRFRSVLYLVRVLRLDDFAEDLAATVNGHPGKAEAAWEQVRLILALGKTFRNSALGRSRRLGRRCNYL